MTASAPSVPAALTPWPRRALFPSSPSSAPRISPPKPCASPAKSASTRMTTSAWKSYDGEIGERHGHLPIRKRIASPEPGALPAFDELTPREIVVELDKYIVGQNLAKKAVAIALRNRVRRQKLPPELAEDILLKNILMIGPTGVGKTEIARRLARLAGCPFVKVEASKYTEVGYVGRDVESMVRDLVETSIDMVREEKLDEVAERAEQSAEERLLDLLLPASPMPTDANPAAEAQRREQLQRTRDKLRVQLREGKLDQRMVEVEVRERAMPAFEIVTNQGVEEMDINVK